jgi:hypothetical protein
LILGYCVRFAGDPPPKGLLGVDGRPVDLLEEGELGLWTSHTDVVAADPDLLRSYDRVIREALRSATPLPLRFGTRFPDEAAARAVLGARHDELIGILERVRGSVEMGVRVAERQRDASTPPLPPAVESRTPASGRDYLVLRRRERREESDRRLRAEAVLARVDEQFASATLDTVLTVAEPPLVGTLAHLVPHRRLQQYRASAEHAIRDMPDLWIRISGPWAPYSFV